MAPRPAAPLQAMSSCGYFFRVKSSLVEVVPAAIESATSSPGLVSATTRSPAWNGRPQRSRRRAATRGAATRPICSVSSGATVSQGGNFVAAPQHHIEWHGGPVIGSVGRSYLRANAGVLRGEIRQPRDQPPHRKRRRCQDVENDFAVLSEQVVERDRDAVLRVCDRARQELGLRRWRHAMAISDEEPAADVLLERKRLLADRTVRHA